MIEDTREPEYTKDDACWGCDGKGAYSVMHIAPDIYSNVECPHCHGTGIEPTRPFHIPHDPERGDYCERD